MKISRIVNGLGTLSIILGVVLLFGVVGGMDFEEVSGIHVPLEEHILWGILGVLLLLEGYFFKEVSK